MAAVKFNAAHVGCALAMADGWRAYSKVLQGNLFAPVDDPLTRAKPDLGPLHCETELLVLKSPFSAESAKYDSKRIRSCIHFSNDLPFRTIQTLLLNSNRSISVVSIHIKAKQTFRTVRTCGESSILERCRRIQLCNEQFRCIDTLPRRRPSRPR